MVIAGDQLNLRHRDYVIPQLDNNCHGAALTSKGPPEFNLYLSTFAFDHLLNGTSQGPQHQSNGKAFSDDSSGPFL